MVTLDIISSRPRHETLDAVKQAVATASGWIAAHHFYSSKAATLQTMIERGQLLTFVKSLQQAGLLSEQSADAATLKKLYQKDDETELTVTCALTFAGDEPELRLTIPAVPG